MTRRHLFVIAAFALTAGESMAQETTTGSIAGRVIDSQGLALPGATVEVVSGQGTRTFVTDSAGRFVAPFLVPGLHSVRVSFQGLRTVERNGIPLASASARLHPLGVGLRRPSSTAPHRGRVSRRRQVPPRRRQLSQIPMSRRLTDVLYVALA